MLESGIISSELQSNTTEISIRSKHLIIWSDSRIIFTNFNLLHWLNCPATPFKPCEQNHDGMLFFSVLAASPLWTAASPSAPDTWATTGLRCRTSPRTRSPVSAPRRPPHPAAPQRRRGSSCRQVSRVTQSPSVLAQDRRCHETVSQVLAHTGLVQYQQLNYPSSSNFYPCQLQLSSATAKQAGFQSECYLKSMNAKV